MARYYCAWRNGSTVNGKNTLPDKCKAQKCIGIWRKYPPACEDFIPDVPTIMKICEKRREEKCLEKKK